MNTNNIFDKIALTAEVNQLNNGYVEKHQKKLGSIIRR